MAATSQFAETHEDFAVRRIRKLVERCISTGERLSRSEFIKQAGLSQAIRTKRVMDCLEAAIRQVN